MSSILLISFIPTHPPTAGNSVRILKQIELLRELGHEIYFAFLADGDSGDLKSMQQYWGDKLHVFHYRNPAIPHVSFYERVAISICNRLKLPFFKWPALKSLYGIDDWYDDNLTGDLVKLTESINPSAVIVEYVFLSKILEYIPDKILKIIDAHDVFTNRNDRADSQWFSTIKSEEALGLNRAHTVLAIQSNDAEYFKKICKANVIVIGHPIDVANLTPCLNIQHINIGYIGSKNMDNVTGLRWFFDNVFPLLQKKQYKLKFTLVGSVCKHLTNLPPSVKCIPFVETLDKIYADVDIMINPAQKGTGLKIKTIEALGFGKPLVTTSIGADGLLDQRGISFELADTPQEFADKLLNLVDDPQRRIKLGFAANSFCNQYNSNISNTLRQIFG